MSDDEKILAELFAGAALDFTGALGSSAGPPETDTRCVMDLETELRVARWLSVALYLCGVPHGPDRVRLDLDAAMALLDPDSPGHEDLFQTVAGHLPQQIREDLERLRTAKRFDRTSMTESTINRIRELLYLREE